MGEDFELVVKFDEYFTEDEIEKIPKAIKDYMSNLDVGDVVVRQSSDEDRRTFKQSFEDKIPFKLTGHYRIAANLDSDRTSKPHLANLGGLHKYREDDPEQFIAKAADAILHEVLAHQVGAGNSNDALIFANYPPNTRTYEEQQNGPYFRSRVKTLMDHSQWRAGAMHKVRPLHPKDQKKIEQRLKPIDRKYK